MSRKRSSAKLQPAQMRVNEVVLTPSQAQTLRLAGAELGAADAGRRLRGQSALHGLEAQLSDTRDAESVRRGLAETISLARGRGEVVEVAQGGQDARGAATRRVRIRSRDGLETLAVSGAIDGRQYRAGQVYRRLYEAADPERDLRSQMSVQSLAAAGSSGGAGGNEAWAERRLRLGRTMSSIEEKIRIADRNGRAVRALREVAGNARCLSHFVAGGGAQATYRRALCLALDVCAGHFGLA